MNVGSLRCARAWLAAFSVVAIACSKPEITTKAKAIHGVALSAQPQGPDHWKAIPAPVTRRVPIYDPNVPSNHVVIWTYGYLSTTIHFTDPLITKDPTCIDKENECTWDVPPGLLKPDERKRKFKYTIGGELDDHTHLDPNDPDIEVER